MMLQTIYNAVESSGVGIKQGREKPYEFRQKIFILHNTYGKHSSVHNGKSHRRGEELTLIESRHFVEVVPYKHIIACVKVLQ